MRRKALSFIVAVSVTCSIFSLQAQRSGLTAQTEAQTAQLTIISSRADYAIGRLYITGMNFSATTAPFVFFNGVQVTVNSFTTTTIDATLPPGVAPGSY